MNQQCGLFVGHFDVKRFSFHAGDGNLYLLQLLHENIGANLECIFLQSQKISLWCNGISKEQGLSLNDVATRIWNDEQCWLDTPHLCENFYGNAIFLGDFDCFGGVIGLSEFQLDFIDSFCNAF
jgi:hypothetical protein